MGRKILPERKVNKGYRAKESVYRLAMQRAKKENDNLSALLESVVSAYAAGEEIRATRRLHGSSEAGVL